MAGTTIWTSLGKPRQGCSSGTWLPMIHSPPLSVKRVSEKLSMAQRIAAHEDAAFKPTPVTIPADSIAIGFMLFRFLLNRDFLAGFLALPATFFGKHFQGWVVRLAELAGFVPTTRH